jgi:hypothetical protein
MTKKKTKTDSGENAGRVQVAYLGKKQNLKLALSYLSESVEFDPRAGNTAMMLQVDAEKLTRLNPFSFRIIIDAASAIRPGGAAPAITEKPAFAQLESELSEFSTESDLAAYCRERYRVELNEDMSMEDLVPEAARLIHATLGSTL